MCAKQVAWSHLSGGRVLRHAGSSAVRALEAAAVKSAGVRQLPCARRTRALSPGAMEAAPSTLEAGLVARAAGDAREAFHAAVAPHLSTLRGLVRREKQEETMATLQNPDFVFVARERIAYCFSCVARTLEPKRDVALILRDALGYSTDEAAAIAGVSEPVLRHRQSEARAHMQRDPFGPPPGDVNLLYYGSAGHPRAYC